MQKETIDSPATGSVVSISTVNDGEYYDVYIVKGTYYSNGRVSNFWHWRRVNTDGSLGKEEHGYGNFYKSENKYKIEIKVKIIPKSIEA